MSNWKVILMLVSTSVLLTGCSFSSVISNSLIALVISITAAIGVVYQLLRDKSEDRCIRKANDLEKKIHNHVASTHAKSER